MKYLCQILLLMTYIMGSYAAASSDIQIKSNLPELGYHIGDIALQTLTITTDKGYRLDKNSLPVIGETGEAVELVSVDASSESHDGKTVHHLVLKWQNFRTMQAVKYYPLLPLKLKFVNSVSQNSILANIPAGRIIVSPVIPAVLKGNAYKQLREDVAPSPEATNRPLIKLLFASAIFFGCLTYLAWYFDWLKLGIGRLTPFREAYREIKCLTQPSENNRIAAMRILRRAFDAATQHAVSAESLPDLFNDLPWLDKLASEITDYFTQSERMFFAGFEINYSWQELCEFSKKLMLLESDHLSTLSSKHRKKSKA